MLWDSCLTVAALVALSAAAAVPQTHAVHERRDVISKRWVKRDRVRHSAMLPVRIGLAQSNLDNGYDYLMDVSDPASPNYGKHWTPEQIIDTFKPSDETVETVYQWLVNSGIPAETIAHSDNQAWFAFHAPASTMESLLHTEYHDFEDQHTGGVTPACEQYHVPKHIQKHIDYITPGVKLVAPMTRSSDQKVKRHNLRPRRESRFRADVDHPVPNPTNLSSCDYAITPACISALYQIPAANLSHPNNSIGVYEAQGQLWSQYDLDLFFGNFTPQIPKGTHPTNILIDGAVAQTNNVSADGAEAMLDLDVVYPIVHPQKVIVFDEDDPVYQAQPNQTYFYGFNHFFDAIDGSYCTYSAYGETGDQPGVDPVYPDPAPGGYKGKPQCGVYKPTNVFSISYGGIEADVPIAYQRRQCNEFMKLGLQGHSFFFASGDEGIGNAPAPYGFDGPTGCLGPKHNIFNPTWPNTCPYVTNVGGTKVYPGKTVHDPESAPFDPAGPTSHLNYSSGGGFSNVFPIPGYQKSAVATYLNDHNPGLPSYSNLSTDHPDSVYTHPDAGALAGNTGGIYNRIGRAYPDVAANGDNLAYFHGGKFGLVYGTSVSTPLFAGVINRINEERLAANKSTVGFINPVLYAHPEVLNDITNGTNHACFGPGFNATVGWDPVTGLGTPNYPKMLKLFMSLP